MCNINRKLKDLIPVLICSLILIISLPANAYKNNPKSTPITEEEFATLGKEIIMQIANDKTADSSHIEMAQKIIKSKGW